MPVDANVATQLFDRSDQSIPPVARMLNRTNEHYYRLMPYPEYIGPEYVNLDPESTFVSN